MKSVADIKEALVQLEEAAKSLVKDEDHGRSPYAGALRSRISAAVDSLDWHQRWMAANPKPAETAGDAATATPAKNETAN